MGVDSFDAAGRRDRLAAQLAELEAATALPPKLAAQLAELEASIGPLRHRTAGVSDWRTGRRPRCQGGGLEPPAPSAAPPAWSLAPAPAPAPAVQAAPLGADGWPSAEWIAARVKAIQSEQRRNRAWTATLLEEIGQPNTGTTRKRVQRACKAVADAKAAAAAAASEPPKAPAWPPYTMPKKRTA
jgi:hypothetical protein